MAEYVQVLRRPKFRLSPETLKRPLKNGTGSELSVRKPGKNGDVSVPVPLFQHPVNHWADLVAMRTVNIGSPSAAAASLHDPKDAPFLAAALAGGADFLITGDRDLLAAKGLVPARIVTIAELAKEFAVATGNSDIRKLL